MTLDPCCTRMLKDYPKKFQNRPNCMCTTMAPCKANEYCTCAQMCYNLALEAAAYAGKRDYEDYIK